MVKIAQTYNPPDLDACPFCSEKLYKDIMGDMYCPNMDCESYSIYPYKNCNTVVHPSHYNWIPGIECMDVVKHFDFPVGNVMKYCWRAGYKSTSTKLEDLKKAKYYIEIAIEMESKKCNSGI